jgi:hypothetical protein
VRVPDGATEGHSDQDLAVARIGIPLSLVLVGLMASVLGLTTHSVFSYVAFGACVISTCTVFAYQAVRKAYAPGPKKSWSAEKQMLWGSIYNTATGPISFTPVWDSYLSAFGMWLFLPINLLLGATAASSDKLYVRVTLLVKSGVEKGYPAWMTPVLWVYWPMTFFLLVFNRRSRFAMFYDQMRRFGGDSFWQAAGLFSCSYARVEELMRKPQLRGQFFAGYPAVCPDSFPASILIFKSNLAPSAGKLTEWGDMRQMMHKMFLNPGDASYKERVAQLEGKLLSEWKPSLADLEDSALLNSLTAKSVLWLALGIWINEQETKVFLQWPASAALFIVPRLFHRFLFGIGMSRTRTAKRSRPQYFRRLACPAAGLAHVCEETPPLPSMCLSRILVPARVRLQRAVSVPARRVSSSPAAGAPALTPRPYPFHHRRRRHHHHPLF